MQARLGIIVSECSELCGNPFASHSDCCDCTLLACFFRLCCEFDSSARSGERLRRDPTLGGGPVRNIVVSALVCLPSKRISCFRLSNSEPCFSIQTCRDSTRLETALKFDCNVAREASIFLREFSTCSRLERIW